MQQGFSAFFCWARSAAHLYTLLTHIILQSCLVTHRSLLDSSLSRSAAALWCLRCPCLQVGMSVFPTSGCLTCKMGQKKGAISQTSDREGQRYGFKQVPCWYINCSKAGNLTKWTRGTLRRVQSEQPTSSQAQLDLAWLGSCSRVAFWDWESSIRMKISITPAFDFSSKRRSTMPSEKRTSGSFGFRGERPNLPLEVLPHVSETNTNFLDEQQKYSPK